jgi:hypothetical protein
MFSMAAPITPSARFALSRPFLNALVGRESTRTVHSLAVRVGFDDRAELLAAAPDIYYVTDHYLNYNAVLVRLSDRSLRI